MAGAVDLNDCLYTKFGRKCKCGYCVICGYAKHTAIHGPLFGQPPGSRPYGHEFVLKEKGRPRTYEVVGSDRDGRLIVRRVVARNGEE